MPGAFKCPIMATVDPQRCEVSSGGAEQVQAGLMLLLGAYREFPDVFVDRHEDRYLTDAERTLAKQMRSASDAIRDEDGLLGEKRGVFHDFYDAELAHSMSRKQGTGLAEVMVRQLSAGEFKPDAAPVALQNVETSANPPAIDPLPQSKAMQPALVVPLSIKES